eukprot:4418310-Alexandrium_andersonii.AAC.1
METAGPKWKQRAPKMETAGPKWKQRAPKMETAHPKWKQHDTQNGIGTHPDREGTQKSASGARRRRFLG